MLPLALPTVADVGLLKRFASEQSGPVRGRWGGERDYAQMMFLPPKKSVLTVYVSQENYYVIV